MFSYLLFSFLFKSFAFLTILVIVFLLGLKLWLDPIKGVCNCKTEVHGKVAIVTGGNSGIGLETARDLARRGARVIIASRDNNKSHAAVTDIVKTTRNFNVEYKHLDLSKFKSIRRFCKDFNDSVERLDILVNNAGYWGVKSRTTEDGFDLTMQVNYLGPFLLTDLLLQKLIDSRPSRIVIVSSYGSHFGKINPKELAGLKREFFFTSYCNTKLCNILWTKALAEKLPQGITVNSLHPGIVKTDIYNDLSGISRKIIVTVIHALFKSPKEGAQTPIHLCVAPELENTSGQYYSDCKPSAFPKDANDDDLIEDIWKESVRLTGSRSGSYHGN